MGKIRIFSAKKIITMNPNQPETTHVAVREGRILSTGTLEELAIWDDYTLDETFHNKILIPGLVEGHAHVMAGALWRHVYCGYFDRADPDGNMWQGSKTIADVIELLQVAESKLKYPALPLAGWQFDPIYMDNQRVTRSDLDQVSATRPVGVLHASGHILNVNSKALELADLLRPGINHPGIPLDKDGLPTGELYGPDAIGPVSKYVGFDRASMEGDADALRAFGKICVRSGVTTITDLAARITEESVDKMLEVTEHPTFPARIVPLRIFMGASAKDTIDLVLSLKERSTDQLRLGRIKAVADGSIQGFSARMRWPGYFNGAPNGLWYTLPEQLGELYRLALANGVQVHTHTNGDEATEMALDTLAPALNEVPSVDHRFTLQHCQLADAAQFRRMRNMKMCVNLFANHHFYWGDEHYRLTVGPERARRMNACRTALEMGVPMAIHSDAPITPLAPLFTAWCAVNRLTLSGRVQGDGEKISIQDALYAITLGAAYTLHLDGEIGSVEIGKKADFAVLEQDPIDIGGANIKDIEIWGTVQGGRVFQAKKL
ncbi:MAG: amidohydrolase [Paracoccaceae bacterium]|nr:amidohydrolase [Paracoccaceae bacterium]